MNVPFSISRSCGCLCLFNQCNYTSWMPVASFCINFLDLSPDDNNGCGQLCLFRMSVNITVSASPACRSKLHFALMRSEGLLQLHKMKWGREWATSMRQFGRVFRSSCGGLTQLWRTLEYKNAFLIMPPSSSSPLGWVGIVTVSVSPCCLQWFIAIPFVANLFHLAEHPGINESW